LNWSEQDAGVTLTTFYAVHFTSSLVGWAVGSDGTILHTDNGGGQWNSQNSGMTDYIKGVHFVNGSKGWIISRKEILYTVDGGSNWNSQFFFDEGTMWDLFFMNEKIGWATGNIWGTDDGVIFSTKDGGITWKSQRTEFIGVSIFFSDFKNGWIVHDNGNILITTDGGYNWYEQLSDCASLNDVYFFDSETGWIVGDWGNILHTNDGGDSNNHPELISSNDIYIKEDSLLNYQAIADDIDGDLITYYFDEYPKWLILGESIISGIPREGVMDTSFVVFASDGKSSDRLLVNVNVLPVNDSPNIISQSGFYAFEDSLFRYTVKATDPEDSTITYSFMDYPDWLYPVDSIIFGTPSNTSQDTSFLALAVDGKTFTEI